MTLIVKKVTRQERTPPRRIYPKYGPSYMNETYRGWHKKPRLYVHVADEGILSHLAFRTSRPVTLYRKALPDIIRRARLPKGTKARWDQHAGCAMCTCSPGFVLTLPDGYQAGKPFDVYATVTADDPMKARTTGTADAIAEAEDRLAQIAADPTLAGPLGLKEDE